MRLYCLLLICVTLLTGCAGPSASPRATPEAPSETASPPKEPSAPEPAPTPEPEPVPIPEPLPEEFVRVQDWLPNIQVDLRYATKDNFTGCVIYDFTDAWLRYGTVQKLSAVLERLEPEGYTLLIWDAFRPAEAQFRLWEVCPDPTYVANPNRGFSSHSRGNTVDLTLVSLDGEAVEMPSGFDDFSARANRDYSDVSQTAAGHARLLEDAMAACGFRPYSGEWWHYSDEDSYPVDEAFSPAEQGA